MLLPPPPSSDGNATVGRPPDADDPSVTPEIRSLRQQLHDARMRGETGPISARILDLAKAWIREQQPARALPLLGEAAQIAQQNGNDAYGREVALTNMAAYEALDDADLAQAWRQQADAYGQRIAASLEKPTAAVGAMAPIPKDAPAPPAPGRAPLWPWLMAPVGLGLLWMNRRAHARAEGLAAEAAALARQQQHLRSAHRALKAHAEELQQTAVTDALTGVMTRQAFTSDLKAVLEHAANYEHLVALFVFDLDRFKDINDGHGHSAGDAALKTVVGVVRENLRSADLFGRFGGDEFLIACADCDREVAQQLADRIRASLSRHVREGRTNGVPLTLSIGIAHAGPATGYSAETLFNRADAALYAAKHAGRDRTVVADDPPASAS